MVNDKYFQFTFNLLIFYCYYGQLQKNANVLSELK